MHNKQKAAKDAQKNHIRPRSDTMYDLHTGICSASERVFGTSGRRLEERISQLLDEHGQKDGSNSRSEAADIEGFRYDNQAAAIVEVAHFVRKYGDESRDSGSPQTYSNSRIEVLFGTSKVGVTLIDSHVQVIEMYKEVPNGKGSTSYLRTALKADMLDKKHDPHQLEQAHHTIDELVRMLSSQQAIAN